MNTSPFPDVVALCNLDKDGLSPRVDIAEQSRGGVVAAGSLESKRSLLTLESHGEENQA